MGTRAFRTETPHRREGSRSVRASRIVSRDGQNLLANRALNNIIRDMLVSFLSAFGIIFVAVTLLYRSIKAGLITMIPNIIPLVVTLGFMGLFGITLRVSTVVAFAICLGMAVDDTIHYLTRFREELDRTGDYITSMYNTLQTAGRAIVLTTSMLVAGFLVFVSSDFKATHDLGLLASVALTSSLLGSLGILACRTEHAEALAGRGRGREKRRIPREGLEQGPSGQYTHHRRSKGKGKRVKGWSTL